MEREKCPNTLQVSLRIQSECGKLRTRKDSVFGHFSRSVSAVRNSLKKFKKSSILAFLKRLIFSPKHSIKSQHLDFLRTSLNGLVFPLMKKNEVASQPITPAVFPNYLDILPILT